MKKICEKANQKLSTLARIFKLTTPTQRKKLMNSFINIQFTYKYKYIFLQRDAIKELINTREVIQVNT